MASVVTAIFEVVGGEIRCRYGIGRQESHQERAGDDGWIEDCDMWWRDSYAQSGQWMAPVVTAIFEVVGGEIRCRYGIGRQESHQERAGDDGWIEVCDISWRDSYVQSSQWMAPVVTAIFEAVGGEIRCRYGVGRQESHQERAGDDGQPVSATVVTFSGYPGGVSSGDDFFLTSTNLAVLGTGVRNQNSDLWSRLTPNNSVPSAFRSLAASRLSSSAKEWIHTYSRSSGGTGNSQWTVIDYNLFKRKVKKLPQDFVWYHEELPRGYSMSADITSFVQTQGYWASYNIPFFPTIFNASGMARLAAEYGDWFTYDRCPRALMFKRGFKDPRDTERVLDFLRYNNYENDPLAVCAACNPKYNAENALSARSDLNPSVGRYPFFEMGLRPHGGTDAKVVNSTMMARHSLWTQCGPTWYEKQAFSWSSSPFASVPHVGQPDYWSFPPAVKEWPDHVTLNSRE
ncbi:putative phospholipase B-like 2 isoform X5 [Dermacentor albipictus]|uniref:putative phospholipase B-like 2 isoform X5 n=1 Tax=Dermacentor albipictus TaxID=60249 RepID=UPI0038FCA7A4